MAKGTALPFSEAGVANLAMTHVRPAPERRAPAPGPAGAGDIRSQARGGVGALAVLAQTPTGEGPAATAVAGAPGLVGDTGGALASAAAPAVGAVGVHFVGGTPTQGLQSSQSPTSSPAGFSPTSGPALVSGSGVIGSNQIGIQGVPNAAAPNVIGLPGYGGGSSTGIGRL